MELELVTLFDKFLFIKEIIFLIKNISQISHDWSMIQWHISIKIYPDDIEKIYNII